MALAAKLLALLIVSSCASFIDIDHKKPESPGYQSSRQLDDKTLKAGFLER